MQDFHAPVASAALFRTLLLYLFSRVQTIRGGALGVSSAQVIQGSGRVSIEVRATNGEVRLIRLAVWHSGNGFGETEDLAPESFATRPLPDRRRKI